MSGYAYLLKFIIIGESRIMIDNS